MQTLKAVLSAHEAALRDAWFDRMLNAYPEESRRYFGRVEKQFTNPVGANLFHSLEALLRELLKEEPDADCIYDELKMILRIKAVQNTRPSQAVSFVPALKQIIDRECSKEIKAGDIKYQDLASFYETLDTVGLYAFDIYTESRDLLYDMRLTQIKETNDILVRANLLDQSLDMADFMKCMSSVGLDDSSCGGNCSSCAESSENRSDIEKGV